MGACCVDVRYIEKKRDSGIQGAYRGGTATNGEEAIERLRFGDSGFGAMVWQFRVWDSGFEDVG